MLLQREVCAQRSIYTQTPLHTEAFMQRSFYTKKNTPMLYITQGFFCTALHLRTDAFTHRRLNTDAFTDTETFTQRNLCTEQLLRKEFPLPPKNWQTGIWACFFFFRFLSFPFQLMHANGWYWDIHDIFVCPLDSFSAFYKWHDAMRNPLLQKDDVTHNSLYTEQLLSAHALTQRGLHREKLLHTDAFIHRVFYANRFWHTEARSLAEPALLFELLSVFLLPLPDHLPFVFPFPSINRCYPWLSHVVLLVDMSDTHITRIGWSYALVSCFFFALDFSGIEEESLPPPTVKKAGSQEVGIWEKVHWTRRFCLLRRNRVYCRLMDWLGFENCIECLLSMKSMVVWGATQDKEETGNFAGGVRAGCPGAWVNHSHVHHM